MSQTTLRDLRSGVNWIGKGFVNLADLATAENPLASKTTMTVKGREIIDNSDLVRISTEETSLTAHTIGSPKLSRASLCI